jgi:hypothetical protein
MEKREKLRANDTEVPGIVIADGRWGLALDRAPRISAFIWGGKVRPSPTLPFGRWKGAA